MTDALSRLRETVSRATGGDYRVSKRCCNSILARDGNESFAIAEVYSRADAHLFDQSVRLARAVADPGMGRHLMEIGLDAIVGYDEFGDDEALQFAQAVLEALAKVAVGE